MKSLHTTHDKICHILWAESHRQSNHLYLFSLTNFTFAGVESAPDMHLRASAGK